MQSAGSGKVSVVTWNTALDCSSPDNTAVYIATLDSILYTGLLVSIHDTVPPFNTNPENTADA